MVLEFGFETSKLFATSNTAGFGLGADRGQAIIDDGGGFRHWWDNITAFDTFTGADNSAIDLTKWDKLLDVRIIDNTSYIGYEPYTYGGAEGTMTLKDALKNGKFIAIIKEIGISHMTSGSSSEIYFEVGNDTDGWTVISTYAGVGDGDYTLGYQSLEATYNYGNVWNVTWNNSVTTQVTLANGFKFRARVYDAGDGNAGWCKVDTVYLRE